MAEPHASHTQVIELIRSRLTDFSTAHDDWLNNQADTRRVVELGKQEASERNMTFQNASDDERVRLLDSSPVETSVSSTIRAIQGRCKERGEAARNATNALTLALLTWDTTARLAPLVEGAMFDQGGKIFQAFMRSVESCLPDSSKSTRKTTAVERPLATVRSRSVAGNTATQLHTVVRKWDEVVKSKNNGRVNNLRLCKKLDAEGVALPPNAKWGATWVESLNGCPVAVRRWLSGVRSKGQRSNRAQNYPV
jgi:hypothetical protein